jgi:hypothetical protein
MKKILFLIFPIILGCTHKVDQYEIEKVYKSCDNRGGIFVSYFRSFEVKIICKDGTTKRVDINA